MPHHLRQPRAPGIQKLRSMEQLRAQSATPARHLGRAATASPTPTSRSVPNGKQFPRRKPFPPPRSVSSNALGIRVDNDLKSPILQADFIRHQQGVSVVYPVIKESFGSAPFLSSFKSNNQKYNKARHGSLDTNLNNINKTNLVTIYLFRVTKFTTKVLTKSLTIWYPVPCRLIKTYQMHRICDIISLVNNS